MFDGSDTTVLYDELAYEDVLPLVWRTQQDVVDASVGAAIAERNMRVLQTCAAIEDHGMLEKTDETAPVAADLLRIESKINLLLDIVGQILTANQPRPPSAPIRFNALGATWRGVAPFPAPGEQGLLEIYLRECLAEPLRLAGRIVEVSAAGDIKAQLLPTGEATADLIEKLAFRRHRRRVADSRQPRGGRRP